MRLAMTVRTSLIRMTRCHPRPRQARHRQVTLTEHRCQMKLQKLKLKLQMAIQMGQIPESTPLSFCAYPIAANACVMALTAEFIVLPAEFAP